MALMEHVRIQELHLEICPECTICGDIIELGSSAYMTLDYGIHHYCLKPLIGRYSLANPHISIRNLALIFGVAPRTAARARAYGLEEESNGIK